MPILDHFGWIAPFYSKVPYSDAAALSARLGLPVGGLVLDAGGGTGRVAEAMSHQAGCFIVADVSMGMLRQAVSRKRVSPVCAETERLAFPDGCFERVVMVDAFHHLASQPESAREMWRVLRPGGRLVIEEPDVRTLAVKLIAVGEKLALMRSHILSPDKIAALFSFPGAAVRIEREGWTAWVVVDKQPL